MEKWLCSVEYGMDAKAEAKSISSSSSLVLYCLISVCSTRVIDQCNHLGRRAVPLATPHVPCHLQTSSQARIDKDPNLS
jgi:hypothetical protein